MRQGHVLQLQAALDRECQLVRQLSELDVQEFQTVGSLEAAAQDTEGSQGSPAVKRIGLNIVSHHGFMNYNLIRNNLWIFVLGHVSLSVKG